MPEREFDERRNAEELEAREAEESRFEYEWEKRRYWPYREDTGPSTEQPDEFLREGE